MNIFRRLFKIGQAEAHSMVDGLENPIKITEQGIRDMKVDLDKSLQALAEVKALAIRARREADNYKSKASEYEKKAMELLERAGQGILEQTEADRLAENALQKQHEYAEQYNRAKADQKRFDENIAKLEVNINKLKSNISKWENELKTLKARAKVSNATKKVNKQMAQIDSSGTISMLERMRDKVEKEEALAEAYGDIANESKSLDEEIETALDTENYQASEALAALKAKMNKKKENADDKPNE